jgi:hypothetical protein
MLFYIFLQFAGVVYADQQIMSDMSEQHMKNQISGPYAEYHHRTQLLEQQATLTCGKNDQYITGIRKSFAENIIAGSGESLSLMTEVRTSAEMTNQELLQAYDLAMNQTRSLTLKKIEQSKAYVEQLSQSLPYYQKGPKKEQIRNRIQTAFQRYHTLQYSKMEKLIVTDPELSAAFQLHLKNIKTEKSKELELLVNLDSRIDQAIRKVISCYCKSGHCSGIDELNAQKAFYKASIDARTEKYQYDNFDAFISKKIDGKIISGGSNGTSNMSDSGR